MQFGYFRDYGSTKDGRNKMYLIVCPYCHSTWYSDKQEKECLCLRCGKKYIANNMELENWIAAAMQRTKGG